MWYARSRYGFEIEGRSGPVAHNVRCSSPYNSRRRIETMNVPRYEKLTVGILIKRESGVFGPRGLALFYDPMQKIEPVRYQTASEEYSEETLFGKLSRIGGKYKYPNVEPETAADLYHRTLVAAGIEAEEPSEIPLRLGLEGKRGHIVRFPIEDLKRGRSIFGFLSTMYYDHRHILTSFKNMEKAKKEHAGQAAVATVGPAVRLHHAERFQPIYIGGTESIDSATVDKSSVILEFFNVDKRQLADCVKRLESDPKLSHVLFEDLLAHQVAYTHSVMWDSKDLPRGYRANLVGRGLGGFQTSSIGELVAYSLFPAGMEARLIDSLRLLQSISVGPPELLQDYIAVNGRIREVVKDEFYADISFEE